MPIPSYVNNFQQNYESIQAPNVIEKIHAEEQLEKLYQLGILRREKEPPQANQPQVTSCFPSKVKAFNYKKPVKTISIDNQQEDQQERCLTLRKRSFIIWKMFYFNEKELQQVEKILSLRIKKQSFQHWTRFIYIRHALAEKASILLNIRAQLSIRRWRRWLNKLQKLRALLVMNENGFCLYQKILKRFVLNQWLRFLQHFREIRGKIICRQLKKQQQTLSIYFKEWKVERWIKIQRLKQLQKLFDTIALYSRRTIRGRNRLQEKADTIFVNRIHCKLMIWREMTHQKLKLQFSKRKVERLLRLRILDLWRDTLEYHYIIRDLRDRILYRHKCDHWAAWKFVVKTNVFERSIQFNQDRNIGRICLRAWKKMSTIMRKVRQVRETIEKHSKRLLWIRLQAFLCHKQKKKSQTQLALKFHRQKILKKYLYHGWLAFYVKYKGIYAFKRSFVHSRKSKIWTKWLFYHQRQQQKTQILQNYHHQLVQKCFQRGLLSFYHSKIIQTHKKIKAQVFYQHHQMSHGLKILKRQVDNGKCIKSHRKKALDYLMQTSLIKAMDKWVLWSQLKKQDQFKVDQFQSCINRFYQHNKIQQWQKNIQLKKKIDFFVKKKQNQIKKSCLLTWYHWRHDKLKQLELYELAKKIYWKKKLLKVFTIFQTKVLYFQKIHIKSQVLTEKKTNRLLDVSFTKWSRLFYKTRTLRCVIKKQLFTICWYNWKQKTKQKIQIRQKMVHFQYQKHYFQLQQVITKWSKWTKQMKTICTIKQKTKKQQLLNCFQLLKTKVLTRNVLYQWHLVARRQALVFHQRGYRFRNFFFKAKQHRVQNCFKQWKQMYFIRQLQNEQWVICKMYLLKELQQAHVSLTKVHKYIRVKWFQRFKRHALWREHRADCFFRHRHLTKVLNKWCHVFVAIKQERLLQNVRQQMKRMSPCYPTIGLKNSGMVDEDTFSIVQQQYSSEQLKNKQRKVQFDLKPSIQNVTRGQQQKQQQQQQQQPLFDTRKSTKTTTNTTATHRKMNSCSTSKEELQIRALYSTARGYGQRFVAKKKQSVNKCLSPVSVILEQDRSFPPLQRKKQSSIAHAQATSRHVAHSTNNKLLLEDCLANFTGEVDDIEKWLANSMEQATNMLQNSTNSGQIEPIATIAATPPPSSTSTFSTTAAVGAVPIIPSPPVAVTPAVVVIEHSTPATVSISRSVSEKELVQQQQEEQVEEEKPTPTTKQAIGSFMSSEDHALLDSIDEEMKHVQQLLTCHKMDTAIKKNQQKQQVDDQCITRLKTLASTSSTSESTTMLSIVDTESTSSVLVPQCKKRIDSGILSVEMDASVHSITTSSESSSAIFSDELSLETLVGLDPYSPPKRPLQKSQRDSMLNSEFSLQEISSSLTSPMDTVENNPVAMEGNTRQQQLVQEEQKKEQKDVLMYHVFFNTVLTYYTSQLSSINRKGTFKGIVLDMLRDLNLLTEDFYLTQIQNVLNKMSIQQDDFILLAFLEQVAKFHPCLDFVRLNQVQFTEQVDMLSKELGVFISMEYFESYPNLMLLLKHHIVPLLLSLQQQQQQYQVNWWTRPHKIPWILYTQDDFLEVVEKNVPWIQNLLKTILLKDGGCSLDFFLQFAQECKLMPKLFTSTQLTTCFQQSCGSYSFSNGKAKFVELVECLVRCSLLFKAPSSLFDKKESRLEYNFIKPKQRPMSSSSTPKEETNLMTLLYAIEGKGSILHKPMKEIHPKNTTTTVENIPCPATRPASPEHVAHKASVKLIKAQRNNLRLLPRPSIQSKATGSIATEVRPLPKYPPRSRPPPISPLLQSQTSTRTTTTLLKKDQENKEKSLVEKNQRLIASKSKVAQQKKQPSKKTLLLNQLYKQDQKEMRKRTNTLLYDFNVDPFSSAILTPSRPRCRPRSSMSVRPTAMVTPCSSPVKQVQITNSTPPISEDNVDAIGLKKDNGETDEDILKQLLKFKETSADEEEQTLMKEVATMLDDFGILVDGSECKSSKKKNVPLRPPEQSIEQDFVLSSDNLDLKSIWRTMFSKDSMEDLNDIFEDAHIGSEITHVDVKDPFLNHLTNVDRFSIARTTKKQFELSQTPPLSSVLFHGIHTLSSEPVSSHVLAHVNDPNLDFLTNPLTNPLGASNCQLFGANDEDIDMKHEAKETKVDG